MKRDSTDVSCDIPDRKNTVTDHQLKRQRETKNPDTTTLQDEALLIVFQHWFNNHENPWKFDQLIEPPTEEVAISSPGPLPATLLSNWKIPQTLNKSWSQWIDDISTLRARVIAFMSNPLYKTALLKFPTDITAILQLASRSARQAFACWKSLHPHKAAVNLIPPVWIMRQELLDYSFTLVASICRYINLILIQDNLLITSKLSSDKNKLLFDRYKHYHNMLLLSKEAYLNKVTINNTLIQEIINNYSQNRKVIPSSTTTGGSTSANMPHAGSRILAENICLQQPLLAYYLHSKRLCMFPEFERLLPRSASMQYKQHTAILVSLMHNCAQQELLDPSSYKDSHASNRFNSFSQIIKNMKDLLVPPPPLTRKEKTSSMSFFSFFENANDEEEDDDDPPFDGVTRCEYLWKHLQACHNRDQALRILLLKKTKNGKPIPPPCLQVDDINQNIPDQSEYALFPDRIRDSIKLLSRYNLNDQMKHLSHFYIEDELYVDITKRFNVLLEGILQTKFLMHADKQSDWNELINDNMINLSYSLEDLMEFNRITSERWLPFKTAIIVRWLIERMFCWVKMVYHTYNWESICPDKQTTVGGKNDWCDVALTCTFWIQRMLEINHMYNDYHENMSVFCGLYGLSVSSYKANIDRSFQELRKIIADKLTPLSDALKHLAKAFEVEEKSLRNGESEAVEFLNRPLSDDLPFSPTLNGLIASLAKDRITICDKMNAFALKCEDIWVTLIEGAYKSQVHSEGKKAVKK